MSSCVTKTLCGHGSRFLNIYYFRLSEASSFRIKKLICVIIKWRVGFPRLNKICSFMCVQKRNYGYTFILQTTKPIFKSIPEHYSEHYFLQVTFRHICLKYPSIFKYSNKPFLIFDFVLFFCIAIDHIVGTPPLPPPPPLY